MTLNKNQILVVIPVFNEEDNILKVVQGLQEYGYEYCVINDGSTDSTKAILTKNDFKFIEHEANSGQGAALRTGFKFAMKNGFKYLVHFDGDGQHRVEDISVLHLKMNEGKYDIIFGSRFLSKESRNRIPFTRRMLLSAAKKFEGIRTGIWLSDAHCGLRILNVKSCSEMRWKANGMAHASELLSETKRLNLKFTEVPVTVNYEGQDQGTGILRIYQVIKELLHI